MNTRHVLEVDGLVKYYRLPRTSLLGETPVLRAVDDVTFSVPAGKSLGIVGESGCGKSTLARTVMGLETPTAGTSRVMGKDLTTLERMELRRLRKQFQMVFQDPYGSLDPRSRVGEIVAEPLDGSPRSPEARAKVLAALENVGLRRADLEKFPHEFSGGQRQRIAIARAMVTEPKLIVADEPVSALDVSVQANVLNLLLDLRERYSLSYLLISHDLAVVEYVCDETVVMYRGRIVEQASARELFWRAAHPYTRLLLDAAPKLHAGRSRTRTAVAEPEAAPVDWTIGCAFRTRCPNAQARCASETPQLVQHAANHTLACHFPAEGKPL